jgi:RND family efflux transporter MFP subunit
VEERLVQLRNATIRAPISGTVGQRNAEVGQLASASTRLFVIGELSAMRIELMLSDRMLNYIDVGVPVVVTSTSWETKALSSSISRISPFLDTNTMRTQAFVEMDNPQNLLRPGMFVTVDILYGQRWRALRLYRSRQPRRLHWLRKGDGRPTRGSDGPPRRIRSERLGNTCLRAATKVV